MISQMFTRFVPRLLLALVLSLVHGSDTYAKSEPSHFYRVFAKTDEAYALAYNLATTVVLSKVGEYVDIVAPPSVSEKLRMAGIELELVQENMLSQFHEIRRKPGYGEYHSYDELLRRLWALERAHPDRVMVSTIGKSWETLNGRGNRPILAIKVADDVQRVDDRRPEVLYFGGVHAREIGTTEVLLSYIEHLAESPESDARVRFLRRNRQSWIIPCLNPDGREHVFSRDIWWRKNRSRPGGPRSTGPIGVDLNRNFGYQWGRIEGVQGSSSDPHSGTYRGSAPFSEPESLSLKSFVLNRKFVASLSYHSYGEYLILPYGFSNEPVPEANVYRKVAREVALDLGYRFGNVAEMVGYHSNGRHDDWLCSNMDGKTRTISMEVELGRTFYPPEDDLPALSKKAISANIVLGLISGAYLETEVTRVDSTPSQVQISLRVRNRGLESARDVKLTLVSARGQRQAMTPVPIPEISGLRGNGALRIQTLDATIRNLDASMILEIEYQDGSPVRQQTTLNLTAD